MKKVLKNDTIRNELKDSSAFFAHNKPHREDEKQEPVKAPSPVIKDEQNVANETTNVSTLDATVQHSFLRRKVRHTFDIYDDQLFSLKEITLTRQKRCGEKVLLGDLVQEALDMFITKERN